MKPQELSLKSEFLDEFRANMDAALGMCVRHLIERGLYKGEVSARIGIEIEKYTDKETGEIYYNMELSPDVKMKIGAKGKLDCNQKKGIVVVPDRTGTPLVASNQIDIDELLTEQKGA